MLRPSRCASNRRAITITRLAWIFALPSLGAHVASADDVVVPSDLEFEEGDIQNCFPLTGCGEHRRYQQVFANSELGALGAPVFITAMTFRPDGLSLAPHTNTSFADMQIRMSTTGKQPPSNQPPGPGVPVPNQLSANFADNVGDDEVVVYSGPLSLTSMLTRDSVDDPYDFDIVIPLQTPFLYDPSAGNLLVEFRNYSGESFIQFADAHSDGGDAIGRVYTNNIFSPNYPEGPVGAVDTWGLVTKLTYTFPTELTLEDIPVPTGEDVPIVNVPNFFVQAADNVVVAGTVDARFCVGHDPRYRMRRGRMQFSPRPFRISEMSNTGSCDDLSHLREIVPASYSGYPGRFPADETGVVGVWFVIADIEAEGAIFDGPLVAGPSAETLIDFTDPVVTPNPPACNTDLPWRQLIMGGDFENGQRVMTVDSVQCNGPRSMTRRTTYLYPARLESTRRTSRVVELVNMERHFVTIGQGIQDIKSCAANETVAEIWQNLLYAQLAFLFGRREEALEYLEQSAFAAKNGNFNGCPPEENYRGRLMADSLSGAFNLFDRYLRPNAGGTWEIYPIPAGLELPLVVTDAPPVIP